MSCTVDQPIKYQLILRLFKEFRDGRRITLCELATHTGTSAALCEALKVEAEKTRRHTEAEILKALFPTENYLKVEFVTRKVEVYRGDQNKDSE